MFFVRQTDQIHLQSPFLSSLSVYDEGTERGATLLRFGHLHPCRRCKELIPVPCLNWGADYLPVAFGWWSWPVRSSLSVYSTGEHFRFLHDDPVVDYLRTGNSLRPATFKRFHTGESSCPCPVFLSYLGLPGDRRPLRQPTILPHLHSYAARCRTTLHTQGHVQSKSKVVDSR